MHSLLDDISVKAMRGGQDSSHGLHFPKASEAKHRMVSTILGLWCFWETHPWIGHPKKLSSKEILITKIKKSKGKLKILSDL